jgi:hypothetical protein
MDKVPFQTGRLRAADAERWARPLHRDLLIILTLSMLAACRAKNTDALKPQDAARWLYQTCGITFAQNPVVLKSTSAARRGTSVSVSATVVLPSAEAAPALESLGKNRSLHRRGQSESRYSYESIPEARPEKECELDTSLHVLYFRYAE